MYCDTKIYASVLSIIMVTIVEPILWATWPYRIRTDSRLRILSIGVRLTKYLITPVHWILFAISFIILYYLSELPFSWINVGLLDTLPITIPCVYRYLYR